jgi:hypothetical protein
MNANIQIYKFIIHEKIHGTFYFPIIRVCETLLFFPFRFVPFLKLSVSVRFVSRPCKFVFVPFRSVSFRFVPFRSVSFRFVPFRSVSFLFVPFRFVSENNNVSIFRFRKNNVLLFRFAWIFYFTAVSALVKLN